MRDVCWGSLVRVACSLLVRVQMSLANQTTQDQKLWTSALVHAPHRPLLTPPHGHHRHSRRILHITRYTRNIGEACQRLRQVRPRRPTYRLTEIESPPLPTTRTEVPLFSEGVLVLYSWLPRFPSFFLAWSVLTPPSPLNHASSRPSSG